MMRSQLAKELSKETPKADRVKLIQEKIHEEEKEKMIAEAELDAGNFFPYKGGIPGSEIDDLDKVSKRLARGTAILQYSFVGEDFIGWAITEQGMIRHYLTTVEEHAVGIWIRRFHSFLSKRPERKISEENKFYAERLSNIFLVPLSNVITQNSRLIIIPYGVGHLLPIHVLPWNGRPLAETHIVTFLPSASFLQFMPTDSIKIPQSPSLLAIGNPAHMNYSPAGEHLTWNPLPRPFLEAEYISRIIPSSTVFTASSATISAVRANISTHKLLRFSTHGYLSPGVPLALAILLANGQALSVYEMMSLHLNADLVVMSACDTGHGKVTPGDDVVGSLARALLAAGAKLAIVTLWVVVDIAACLLMGEFYQCLLLPNREKFDAARALRDAQMWLRGLTNREKKLRSEEMRQSLTLRLSETVQTQEGDEYPTTTTTTIKSSHVVDLLQRSLADVEHECNEMEQEQEQKQEQERNPSARVEPEYYQQMLEAHGKVCPYQAPYYWAPFILIGV
ncbi:MAG: hypothetical protein M1834_002810 [Cirrosporium novae-zelandiae]|nr:MAG: hypothetical protein M1834_002810 [Cirrosporium novae-zelandiae]